MWSVTRRSEFAVGVDDARIDATMHFGGAPTLLVKFNAHGRHTLGSSGQCVWLVALDI